MGTQNGGSVLTSFNLYRSDDYNTLLGSVTAYPNQTDYSYIDNSVSNGNSYQYEVSALNRDGESAKSVASNSCIVSGLPDAPANVRIQVNSNFLVVFWNLLAVAPSADPNDEGSQILSYNIYRDGALIDSVDASHNNYSDGSIAGNNGVSYGYQISAVSANGEGAKSATVSESSAGSPDTPANF